MEEVKLNDCLLTQFTPRLDLSTPIQVPVLCLSLGRGPSQLTKLILMQTHVASETTSQSLSTPPGVSMSMPVMSQSSPFQTHQLCQALLPGMNQSLARPMFWSQMKHFTVAQNQITPFLTPTKSEVLELITGIILLMIPGLSPSGLLILA